MSTLSVVENTIPLEDNFAINVSLDLEQFLKHENNSDRMGLPGILATSIVLGLMTLTTIIGNVFVIAAILLERNLHCVANYLILSLAVADLFVAVLVMPLGAVYEISSEWTFGPVLCDIWTSSDVLCCTASILHLLAIAIDRYWAVTHVHYIHNRTFRTIGGMIAFIWITSIVVSLAPLFGWKDSDFEMRVNIKKECIVSQDVGYQIFATMATFYVPLVLILLLYWRIFVTARNRLRTRLAQKTKLPERLPKWQRKTSNGQASGIVSVVASAHFNRKGHQVIHSAAPDFDRQEANKNETMFTSKGESHSKLKMNKSLRTSKSLNFNNDPSDFCSKLKTDIELAEKSHLKMMKNGDESNKIDSENGDKGCQTSIENDRKSTFNGSILKKTRRDFNDQMGQRDRNNPFGSSFRQNKKKHVSMEAKRERKAAKTLAIVTGAFIAFWLPFFIFAIVMAIFKDHEFNRTLVSFFLWLGYFNSTLNPIIYTIFSPDFRSAFKRILCGKQHSVNHWPRHLQ